MSKREDLVVVKNLKKYSKLGKSRPLKAVDDNSFIIKKGEALGLEVESSHYVACRLYDGVIMSREDTVSLHNVVG